MFYLVFMLRSVLERIKKEILRNTYILISHNQKVLGYCH